jgi:hypothetical protein
MLTLLEKFAGQLRLRGAETLVWSSSLLQGVFGCSAARAIGSIHILFLGLVMDICTCAAEHFNSVSESTQRSGNVGKLTDKYRMLRVCASRLDVGKLVG